MFTKRIKQQILLAIERNCASSFGLVDGEGVLGLSTDVIRGYDDET